MEYLKGGYMGSDVCKRWWLCTNFLPSPSFSLPASLPLLILSNFFQKRKEVWGSGGAENDNWRKVFIGPGGDLSLLDL